MVKHTIPKSKFIFDENDLTRMKELKVVQEKYD